MMKFRFVNPVSAGLLLVCFMLTPILQAGTSPASNKVPVNIPASSNIAPAAEAGPKNASPPNMASRYYDSMRLQKFGLSRAAWEYAIKGYHYLLNRGLVDKPGIITVCDFSQSSGRKRLYVINLNTYKVVMNTYVAHGKNSGGEYANSFSNVPESNKSSLGFYITHHTYTGSCGYSLRLKGFDRGFNDNAFERDIVMHGSDYVGEKYLRNSSQMGRSFGCPAVPMAQHKKIIDLIKNGTCLFIYHPTKKYLKGSRIINS